ncbi:MAG: histidine kinase [Chitinophagaceae bacterium]|nr:histidine kinase [Chitinophagaceae bacterium]
MMIMIYLDYWKLNRNTRPEVMAKFLTGFFFHLFLVLLTFSGWGLIYFLYHYVKGVRREEQLRTAYQFKMNELEAKALRAQMNPHFIFNCLNSIKSLIQQNENEKSVTYLTTFSKLIRTLLNNADKKEISLYDEIETCKLYLQLEAMRLIPNFLML